jgi:hypothetical protein
MAIDPPRSVVLNYDQDSQRLNVQLVEPSQTGPASGWKIHSADPVRRFRFQA